MFVKWREPPFKTAVPPGNNGSTRYQVPRGYVCTVVRVQRCTLLALRNVRVGPACKFRLFRPLKIHGSTGSTQRVQNGPCPV